MAPGGDEVAGRAGQGGFGLAGRVGQGGVRWQAGWGTVLWGCWLGGGWWWLGGGGLGRVGRPNIPALLSLALSERKPSSAVKLVWFLGKNLLSGHELFIINMFCEPFKSSECTSWPIPA